MCNLDGGVIWGAPNSLQQIASTQAGLVVVHKLATSRPVGWCRSLEVTVQKSRPTQNKRARERARQEKQQQKTARRQEAATRKASRPSHEGAEDPDIAGIVPGPQASPWGDEFDDLKEEEVVEE